MAIKKVEIPGVGSVTLAKHGRSRSIRLTVGPSGNVRVSMPHWTPYAAGMAFAQAHAAWISEEQNNRATEPIENGQRVGKQHYVRFEQVFNDVAVGTRVTKDEVIVRYSSSESLNAANVQERAKAATIRALKNEAKELLPPRLATLAREHNFTYRRADIKLLKRRWGSCSSERVITLNLYLMELPWECIDYVLLHELSHTKQLHHGPDFWQLLTSVKPEARAISKQLRGYQPQIGQPNLATLVA
ncbi:MAG: SprT family zinc-dependent metalloprotease [Candidatus Saccharimonadales bacterium]